MYKTMIKIKNTWLEDRFNKDYISVAELANAFSDKCDEVEYLEDKVRDLENKDCEIIEEYDYADELHEMKMLGEIE